MIEWWENQMDQCNWNQNRLLRVKDCNETCFLDFYIIIHSAVGWTNMVPWLFSIIMCVFTRVGWILLNRCSRQNTIIQCKSSFNLFSPSFSLSIYSTLIQFLPVCVYICLPLSFVLVSVCLFPSLSLYLFKFECLLL